MQIMMYASHPADWRKLKTGDKLYLQVSEFDGAMEVEGVVSETSGDHAIMTGADGSSYWIDDDTAFQFRRPFQRREKMDFKNERLEDIIRALLDELFEGAEEWYLNDTLNKIMTPEERRHFGY